MLRETAAAANDAMTKSKRKPKFPDRKISETLLHFAEPLLEPLGPRATEEHANQALQIAFTVWNAMVYEAANGDTRFMAMLHYWRRRANEYELENRMD